MASNTRLMRTFCRLVFVAGGLLIAVSLLNIGRSSSLLEGGSQDTGEGPNRLVRAIDSLDRTAAPAGVAVDPAFLQVVVAPDTAAAASSATKEDHAPAAAPSVAHDLGLQQQPQPPQQPTGDEAPEGYDVELVQKHRQATIDSICRQRKELKRATPWRYKFDPKHNMLYCPIPKSGWSSWKRVFFYVNGAIKDMEVEIGITPDKNASILEFTGFAIIRRNISGTFRPYSFMFVRDPWQRLLSAYINKALDWNYTRILHTPCESETMTPYRPPITFTQFLTCIVDRDSIGKRLDIHWTPMWQLCDMCQIRYNAIGHMETMAADARHVLASNRLNLTFPRVFSSRAHKPADVARSWYESVPASILRRLQKLYELDFLLNDYSKDPPGWEGKL